jgi:hypothetical protein
LRLGFAAALASRRRRVSQPFFAASLRELVLAAAVVLVARAAGLLARAAGFLLAVRVVAAFVFAAGAAARVCFAFVVVRAFAPARAGASFFVRSLRAMCSTAPSVAEVWNTLAGLQPPRRSPLHADA